MRQYCYNVLIAGIVYNVYVHGQPVGLDHKSGNFMLFCSKLLRLPTKYIRHLYVSIIISIITQQILFSVGFATGSKSSNRYHEYKHLECSDYICPSEWTHFVWSKIKNLFYISSAIVFSVSLFLRNIQLCTLFTVQRPSHCAAHNIIMITCKN